MSDMGINNVPLEPDRPKPDGNSFNGCFAYQTLVAEARAYIDKWQAVTPDMLREIMHKMPTDWHDWQPKKDDEP